MTLTPPRIEDRLLWTRRGSGPRPSRTTMTHVRRGVYAETTWWESLRPSERYRLRIHATSRSLQDPVFALESAAVIHGLPVFGEPGIHLHSPSARATTRRGPTTTHASIDAREIVRIDGVRATSIVDTVADLIRVLPLALAVAVLDAAVRAGIELSTVEERLQKQASRRGLRNARRAIELCDPAAESVLESISRIVIMLLGYPTPELQTPFRWESRRGRTDFYWRELRIAGEADGNEKYFGGKKSTDETVREERRREVVLRRLVAGLARWEWADAIQPARLDAILAAAGLKRIRPADPLIESALRNRRTRP